MSNSTPPSRIDSLAATDNVSRDDIFEAFADSRRRIALTTIASVGTPVELRTLARSVAREEAGSADPDIPEDELENVAISLYHAHLPKLANLGLVEFDARERVVESAADGVESLHR